MSGKMIEPSVTGMKILLGALLMLVGVGRCAAQFQGASPAAPAVDGAHTASIYSPANDLLLAPGDSIDISLFGVKEVDLSRRISNRGTVDFPGLGNITLAGLTTEQAEELLRQRTMKAELFADPTFVITVSASPTSVVTVLGEVKEPKILPAIGPLRLLDVLSECGGMLVTASPQIIVNHRGDAVPDVITLSANPLESQRADVYLKAGDTVVVSRMGVVYAVGQVKAPAAIPLTGSTPLTLLQTITRAGGPNYGAALSKVIIARNERGSLRAIHVDLARVLDRKDPDVILQADDIVYVPSNAFKASIAAGGAAVLAQAATAVGVLK